MLANNIFLDLLPSSCSLNSYSTMSSSTADNSDHEDDYIEAVQSFRNLAKKIGELQGKDKYLARMLAQEKKDDLKEGFLNGKKVTPKMRTKVVKWIAMLCEQLELSDMTEFSAVGTLDHYLSSTNEQVSSLQLAAATCIYISSKVHESKIISVEVFVYSCSDLFTGEQLLEKEKEILVKIGFRMNHTNTYRLLKELNKQFKLSDAEFTEEVRLLKIAQENTSYYKYPNLLIVEAAILLAEEGPRSAKISDIARLEMALSAFSTVCI